MWEYYKLHIIIVLLVAVAVIYTCYAILNAQHYDMEACISVLGGMSSEAEETISEELKETLEDIDGDGEINILFSDCSVPASIGDESYAASMESKFYLGLQSGEVYMLIVSEDMVKKLTANPAMEGFLEEAASWSGETGEYTYFADASGSAALRRAGMPADGVYIGIKNFNDEKDGEEGRQKYENAVSAAKFILKTE